MPDATAYGYAQRRSWIFFAWWYPAVLERGIRGTPVMVWTILVATTAAVVAMILFTPNGASPETLPVLGLLVTVPLGSAAGLLHTRRLMCNSAGLYARWLKHRSLTEHS